MKNYILGMLTFLLLMLGFFSTGLSYTGQFSQEYTSDRGPGGPEIDDTNRYYETIPYAQDYLPRSVSRSRGGLGSNPFLPDRRMLPDGTFVIINRLFSRYGSQFGQPLPLDSEGNQLGDLDLDGDVDEIDCRLATQSYAKQSGKTTMRFGNEGLPDYFYQLDINGNGHLDRSDAEIVCQYARGGKSHGKEYLSSRENCASVDEGRLTCMLLEDPSYVYVCAPITGDSTIGRNHFAPLYQCPDGYQCAHRITDGRPSAECLKKRGSINTKVPVYSIFE